MAKQNSTSQLDRLQVVVLDDRDFLKQIVESFYQSLLEEMIHHFQADLYQ